MDMGRFILLTASLVPKLWHARLLGCHVLGAMSSLPRAFVQLPLPVVGAFVKCIGVIADANLFVMEHDRTATVIEVVTRVGLLLPQGSICRVLHLGLDPVTGTACLGLQAWDVPLYGYGGDARVRFMRTMTWVGAVRLVWVPRHTAETLPVCRLVWEGLGAEQESDQVATAPELSRIHDAV